MALPVMSFLVLDLLSGVLKVRSFLGSLASRAAKSFSALGAIA